MDTGIQIILNCRIWYLCANLGNKKLYKSGIETKIILHMLRLSFERRNEKGLRNTY